MNPVGEVVVRPGHGEGCLEDDGLMVLVMIIIGIIIIMNMVRVILMFGSRVPRHTLMPFKSVGEPD